jgi:hypothetical protein
MPNPHVVIEEFKDASRPGSTWRLNWFGGVERDPKVATEYKLQVVLTKVKDDAKGAWHTERAVEQDILRMVPIGIGQLPLLRMGSLWRDGKLEMLRSGDAQVFDLDIPPGLPNYYIATDKIGLSGLVPFRDHRLMGFGKNTKCLVLPHNGDPAGIIIPAIELIRFYYANSTRLSKAIFDGDFIRSPSSIYDPDYSGLVGKCAVVCRRQDVCDDDCWTIARVLNSQIAFDGARRVIDSMMRDFANTRQANPESAFPFSGKTQIKALCKKVGYDPARWLVLSLVSCTAPFPYEELQVMADNDGRQANQNTDLPGQAKIPINRPRYEGAQELKPLRLQSAQEPDGMTLPSRLELSEDKFQALAGKRITKQDKKLCHYKAGELTTVVDQTPSISGTADGSHSGKGIGKAEFVSTQSDALPPSYDLLIELVQELNTRTEVSARLFPLANGAGLVKVPLTAPAGRRQWAYIDRHRRQTRHIMVVEINFATNHYYLVEIERRPGSSGDKYCAEIYFLSHRAPFSETHIAALATRLSKCDGRVTNDEILSIGLRRLAKGLRHTDSCTADYARRIINNISACATQLVG